MAIGPGGLIISVWPSGAARMTSSAPTLPDAAPLRFST